MGRAARPLMVEDADGPLAFALCLRGPLGLPALLRGPIWLRQVAEDQRRAALALLRLRMIEAEAPDTALRKARFLPVMTPAHIAEWDLTTNRSSRDAAMSGKWRNALRQAEAAPIRLEQRPFHGDTSHPIFALSTAHARTLRYRPVPAHLTCAMARQVPRSARIFTALHNRQPIAHILMLHLGPVVTYQIGWTGPEGRRFNAHHRLLSEAADFYADRGCTLMDLGTVDTDTAPGLARFKIGTGARIRPLGGSHIRLWP